MGELTFATSWAVVLVVEFLAGVFVGLGAGDLPSDVVGEMAVHAVFAVASEVVDAGVQVPVYMDFLVLALGVEGGLAFFHCEVLLGAVVLEGGEVGLESFVLDEVSVVHSTIYNLIIIILLD